MVKRSQLNNRRRIAETTKEEELESRVTEPGAKWITSTVKDLRTTSPAGRDGLQVDDDKGTGTYTNKGGLGGERQ